MQQTLAVFSHRSIAPSRTDRHPCPWRDSNPPSQQASGRRCMSQTARPLNTCIFTV